MAEMKSRHGGKLATHEGMYSTGLINVLDGADHLKQITSTFQADNLAALGHPFRHLESNKDIRELESAVSSKWQYATFNDTDTNGDARVFCNDLMDLCKKQGVEFRFGTRYPWMWQIRHTSYGAKQ